MKKVVVVCAAALFLSANEGFAEEWKWFCEVEYSAGVLTDENGRTFSGNLAVPEDSKHLLARVEKNQLDSIKEKICRDTLDYFNSQVANNRRFHIEDQDDISQSRNKTNIQKRQWFGHDCLTSEKLVVKEITKESNPFKGRWEFYSYGGPDYEGSGPGSWFGLYGAETPNPSFLWGKELFVQTGHCKVISR